MYFFLQKIATAMITVQQTVFPAEMLSNFQIFLKKISFFLFDIFCL